MGERVKSDQKSANQNIRYKNTDQCKEENDDNFGT